MGQLLNSHGPTVAEPLAHRAMTGCSWTRSTDRWAISNYRRPWPESRMAELESVVRVEGYHDRGGIEQGLDMEPTACSSLTVNSADDARQAVRRARFPTAGTRSVYFPPHSTNRAGRLGHAGAANDNVIRALQVETDSCINKIEEMAALAGVDLLLLPQNDLSMSMGLCEKKQGRRSWAPPPIGFGEPRNATTSFWAGCCSEPPASANSWEKPSLSSASVTISTTSWRRTEPT